MNFKNFIPGGALFPEWPRALLRPRQSIAATSGAATAVLAATTSANITASLDLVNAQAVVSNAGTPIPQGQAVLFEEVHVVITPSDNTRQLQLANMTLGYFNSAAAQQGIVIPWVPPFTLTPAGIIQWGAFPNFLLTGKNYADLAPAALVGALRFITQFTNLDAANPHSVQVGLTAIYRLIEGIED